MIDETYLTNVVSSKVRLIRNVKGLKFFGLDAYTVNKLTERVFLTLKNFGNYDCKKLNGLSTDYKNVLIESKILNPDFNENGSMVFNEDFSSYVLLNGEDVIREYAVDSGFSLNNCFNKVTFLDKEISKCVNFAFDKVLGYLTRNPKNLGTGLKASVNLFLPALSKELIYELNDELIKLGFEINREDNLYTYSVFNTVSLGATEYEIIQELSKTVEKILVSERLEENNLKQKEKTLLTGRINNSANKLLSGEAIDYETFKKNISVLKLGNILNLISVDNALIDELTNGLYPSVLRYLYGDKEDVDVLRGKIISKKLKEIL